MSAAKETKRTNPRTRTRAVVKRHAARLTPCACGEGFYSPRHRPRSRCWSCDRKWRGFFRAAVTGVASARTSEAWQKSRIDGLTLATTAIDVCEFAHAIADEALTRYLDSLAGSRKRGGKP